MTTRKQCWHKTPNRASTNNLICRDVPVSRPIYPPPGARGLGYIMPPPSGPNPYPGQAEEGSPSLSAILGIVFTSALAGSAFVMLILWALGVVR